MMTESIGTLLAVDDEPEIRNLTAEFAKSWGFKVLLAEDGEAAIDILKNQKPDVIISDMAMPIKDGFSFLKQIRDDGHQTPFLFLSAYMAREHTVNSLNLGAIDYLAKPFAPNELKVLLYEMLLISKLQKDMSGNSTLVPSKALSSESALRHFSEIMQLATQNHGSESHKTTAAKKQEQIQLFSIEARQLLTLGQAILKELEQSATPGLQICYLFRIMKAIRTAATQLELYYLRDLAQAMEQNYILLRVRSIYINPLALLSLNSAHDLLRRNLESIDPSDTLNYDEKFALTKETIQKIQEIRSVAAAS